MNVALALAQREREGPVWASPHRLSAKTTFVVLPSPANAERTGDNGMEQESGHTITEALSEEVLHPTINGHREEPFDRRLFRATSSRRLMQTNTSFVSRFHLAKRLAAHRGCVNSIQWNSDGTLLITGSDDCKLNIYSCGPRYKQLHNIRTGHSRNIFCAKFVPYTNDSTVISCGMDGEIRCNQVERDRTGFVVHSSPMHMVLKMAFLPGSSSVFLSTHQDGTVRLFDLRLRESNPENVVVDLRNSSGDRVAVNSLAMCPLGSHKFALACGDPVVRLYDIRKVGSLSTGQRRNAEGERNLCIARYCPRSVLETNSRREHYGINVTGVDFNELGEIAATYSRVDAYVFSTNPLNHHEPLTAENAPDIDPEYRNVQTGYVQVYKGHRNVRTFLKEISFLCDNEYVTTGSDCGHAFMWHKRTGKLVNMLKADDSVVNGVAPHPSLPYLATCGIDSDGKIWEPGDDYTFNPEKAEKVMGRNSGDGEEEDGVRISLLNLFNFLTMIRAREAGQRRDQERASEEDGRQTHEASQSREEEEEEEEEEEDDEDETTAQLLMDLEMVSIADEIRTKGNRLFQAEDYDGAEAEYSRALEHLFALQSRYGEVLRRKQRSRLLCLLNRAACNLKRQQWQQVVDDSSEVLLVQPANVKALFRRAKAFLELKQYNRSLRDVLLAEQLTPDNGEITRLHEQLREAMAAEGLGADNAPAAEEEEAMDTEAPASVGDRPEAKEFDDRMSES